MGIVLVAALLTGLPQLEALSRAEEETLAEPAVQLEAPAEQPEPGAAAEEPANSDVPEPESEGGQPSAKPKMEPEVAAVPETTTVQPEEVSAEEPPPSSEVYGIVWKDEDGDGLMGPEESGLEGIPLVLQQKQENGSWLDVARIRTNADGRYEFPALEQGSYRAGLATDAEEMRRLQVGARYAQGEAEHGSAFYADSEAIPLEKRGATDEFVLDGFNSVRCDCALVDEVSMAALSEMQPMAAGSSIYGCIWFDANANGVMDVGETGIDGINVTLQVSADLGLTWSDLQVQATTNQDNGQGVTQPGTYVFTVLGAGIYRVVLDLSMQGGLTIGTGSLFSLVSGLPQAATSDVSLDGILSVEAGGALVLGMNTAIVYSFAELKAILTNTLSTVTYIYFGADITGVSGGITIPTTKNNITLDGHPPFAAEGMNYTYTDYPSNAYTNCIVVQTTDMNFTIRNMNISGKNYYGPVVVIAGTAYAGVTLSYINVNYTGPQLTYNCYGTNIYENVNVTLAQNGAPNTPEEMVQGCNVIFRGNVTVTKSNTGDAIFASYATPSLTVEAGATVNITTPYYLIYTWNYNPTVTIGQNASVTVNTARGFTWDGQRVASLSLAQGASLAVTQTASVSYGAIHIASGGALSVGPDATLDVRKTGGGTNGAIQLDSGATASFSNPKRVLLTSPANGVFSGGGSNSLNVSAQAVNVWSGVSDPAQSAATKPTNQWNRLNQTTQADGAPALSFKANFGGSMTSVTDSNLASGDPATAALGTASLNLVGTTATSVRMLVLGEAYLAINSVLDDATAITGSAGTGAALVIDYQDPQNAAGRITATDGSITREGGSYSTPIQNGRLAAGSQVNVASYENYLWVQQYTLVQLGGYIALAVPGSLAFQTTQLSAEAQTALRQQDGWTVSVADSRTVPAGWSLTASVSGPLAATDGSGDTLPGALVFVEGTGTPTRTPLSTAPILIYEALQGAAGTTNISWAQSRGLLVDIAAGAGRPGTSYEADINWTLQLAP